MTSDGVIDLNAAQDILKRLPPRSLVSVMAVNNETGVIQPVAAVTVLAKRCGHFMHVDAVQAVGRLPIDFAALGVDALTVSAHKIGGMQGVGALIVSDSVPLKALIKGGGQERNRRAGTENVPGIVGFGKAAQLAADDLRDAPRLTAIGGEQTRVIGANAPRVANTLSSALRSVSGETQVAAMDLAGVAVSAGSACSSGKTKASRVLGAMGCGAEIAGCALRISLGWHTTEQDIERCIKAWQSLYQRAQASQYTQAA